MQLPSAASVPPENVMVVVPTPATLPPQLFEVNESNVSPARAAARSSANATPVAASNRS